MMPVTCPHCGAALVLFANQLGQSVDCRRCRRPFQAPGTPASAPAATAPPAPPAQPMAADPDVMVLIPAATSPNLQRPEPEPAPLRRGRAAKKGPPSNLIWFIIGVGVLAIVMLVAVLGLALVFALLATRAPARPRSELTPPLAQPPVASSIQPPPSSLSPA
jgi:hypothetical protein